MAERVLVVDDEPRARDIMADILSGAGMEVLQAGDGEEAIRLAREHELNLVLLDLFLPDMSGTQVLEAVLKAKPALPVVMISGQGSIQDAVKATKLGAYDFLEKPAEREKILLAARNALERDRLRRELSELREESLRRYRMVGTSSVMHEIFQKIDEIAPTRAPVLVTGESGGGKELVARAIHLKSDRKEKAFVKLNCAAIPETLIESELFGYEKGAFTGALTKKKGKLEVADGGTLLLDEVGDLSLSSQAKLLRFLQENEFERLGATTTIRVDVRVVSATNKNLRQEIDEKRFREDLYFRLNVLHIHVPPLRERRDDIPLLADHFLGQQCEENGVPKKQLTPEAVEFLKSADWAHNNARELENLMKRAAILVKAQDITPRDLLSLMEPMNAAPVRAEVSLREAREEFERDFIRASLAHNNGDKTRTAEELGIERTHLHRKLKDLGITE
ncbi:sigma-54-dependent Fis family transcriptional regulator [candidate division WOR-3 bacterium]|nr:sigma-54-dependent Fis family transcriptional regulator [candidate division WOR-3 bacterium]